MLKQLLLGWNGIATQKISNIHFLDIINFYPTTGQIHESRDATHMKRKAFKLAEHLTATTSTR
ncbi:hypothetical protein D3C76_1736590 [compost metagenome]